jgi:uncharacterized protein with HEPN domain
MSKSDDLQFLRDIVKYGELAHDKVQGVTHEEYDADSTLQFAVAFLVLIVGEAASRLSDTARSELSGVPWREIIGMRNRLVAHLRRH